MSDQLPGYVPDDRHGGRTVTLSSRKLARLELRLAAIEGLVEQGTPLAAATRQVFLGPLGPYSKEPPPRPDSYWCGQHARLVRLVAPERLEQAREQATARVAKLADAAGATLDEVVRGDFGRTRDEAAAARVRLEGSRTVYEILGLVKRPGGLTVAQQVNVSQQLSPEHEAARAKAADILKVSPLWQKYWYACGVADATGKPRPQPPGTAYQVHRIEDDPPPEGTVAAPGAVVDATWRAGARSRDEDDDADVDDAERDGDAHEATAGPPSPIPPPPLLANHFGIAPASEIAPHTRPGAAESDDAGADEDDA